MDPKQSPWMPLFFIVTFLLLLAGPSLVVAQLDAPPNMEQGGADPLSPEQAFVFSASRPEGGAILLQWRIADGHYLYRNKFTFSLSEAQNISLGSPTLPPGDKKEDPYFGSLEVYHGALSISLPLVRPRAEEAAAATLVVTYQGCAERGICYPPLRQTIVIRLPGGGPAASRGATPLVAPVRVLGGNSSSPAIAPVAEQDRIAAALGNTNLFVTVVTFFGFGLLLAFTPCIFPMIPILSGIIVGQGESLTTRRAFILSLVYVLAMALTYTFVGIMAALFGENLQATFQNPWILGAFSGVFVILALSMFGFYRFQMPVAFQKRLASASNRQQGGGLLGVAVMGILSSLIVGPCVAAPLAGALFYIGQTGDALLGGLALFAMGMGMGAPLLLIGTSAGKILPRSGAWMGVVKNIFGVLLLGVAVWLLQRVIPGQIGLMLWAALLIIPAIYMGALEPLLPSASGLHKLWKGLGVLFVIYGVLLLLGAASGAQDPLQPLKGLAAMGRGGTAAQNRLNFTQIKGVSGLEAALSEARERGEPVFLDFYADWCVSCKELESYTFSDAGVQQALSSVRSLQADVTANDAEDRALMKSLGIYGPPALLFFDASGQEVASARLLQFMAAGPFVEHIKKALP